MIVEVEKYQIIALKITGLWGVERKKKKNLIGKF